MQHSQQGWYDYLCKVVRYGLRATYEHQPCEKLNMHMILYHPLV